MTEIELRSLLGGDQRISIGVEVGITRRYYFGGSSDMLLKDV